MKNIVASNEEVVEVIGNIAAATAEQANSIDQINQAVTRMENSTQHNAAIVKQTAADAAAARTDATAGRGRSRVRPRTCCRASMRMPGVSAAGFPMGP